MQPTYDPGLVLLSIVVAMLASFVALSLAHSITFARGRARIIWLTFGSMAMGFGIWSMHFVGMLAFSMPGMPMAYDIPLMILSVVVAIAASALALLVMTQENPKSYSTVFAALAMGIAIAGMHYIGMASMRMPATIKWNGWLVLLSIIIAIASSYVALRLGFRSRKDTSTKGLKFRGLSGVVMGLAISGMHYTGMLAATFYHSENLSFNTSNLLVSSTLTVAVALTTVLILSLALTGSMVDRALARRANQTQKMTQLYTQAQEALKALQEERDLRELFVSSLTHDLRTPVTAAKLNAQLLFRQVSDDSPSRRVTSRIEDNLERIEKMIQDLLDAHRISANQQLPIKPEKCDLVQLTKETLDVLATVYGNRFQLKCEYASLVGNWDSGYLQRIIENLGNNAVKYGHRHMQITVSLDATPTRVELSVHNHGPPISNDERKNLFILFHRAQSAQVSGTKGWGIGLALVKGVAEAHGGSIKVESHATDGTKFVVSLPRTFSETVKPAQPEATSS